MEKRYLQRTGGASFTVTLPKQWVEQFGLQDKDPVELSVQNSGAILIQPARDTKKLARSILKIDKLRLAEIGREIIAGYLSGADEIVVESNRFTPTQHTQIRQTAQSLMGLEIIDVTSTQIHLRNIFDILKFSIPQNIEKMFFMTQSMFEDAMLALTTRNLILAKDVVERDAEVDKLNFVIMRQFNSLVTGKGTEESIGMSLVNCNYYAFIATQIERIADHTTKIANTVISMPKNSLQNRPSKILEKRLQQITASLENSKQLVKTLNKDSAHAILDLYESEEQQELNRQLARIAIEPIIIDSLDRMQRYILNIAEMTIDQSAMTS